MSIYSRYHSLSDEDWLRLLIPSPVSGRSSPNLRRRLFERVGSTIRGLPRLPDPQVQKNFVGSAGKTALREGFHFYQVIKEQCRAVGRPLSAEARILDFGCGWGRIFRFFLKDVHAENLLGIDVDPDIIRVCRETIREGRFETVAALPPTTLADSSFDVVYAYSVFSHLSESAHLQWVREIERILVQGGLLIATTQKRSFIEYCNALTDADIVTDWHRLLAKSFRPMEVSLARYDNGDFVYTATGGGGVRDASFYGEAAVSERYIDRHWPPSLTKLVFDQQVLPQALIVAQRV